MIKQEFDYKINGNSYNVILYLKSKKQRNIYYRFKENHFEISAPLSVKIEDIYKGLDQYGKGLIKKGKSKNKPFSNDGVYILGNFVSIKDGFVNVLGRSFLFKDEENFYKQAKKIFLPILTSRVHYFEKIMGVDKPYNVSLYYKSSAYGTNTLGSHKIILSSYLIHFSMDIIDSVIVHELAHFYIRNHSKSFYNVVYKFCPKYDELHKKLSGGIFSW